MSSWENAEALGLRAKLRRLENGQSSAGIEAALKMTPGLLRQWENRLPRKPRKVIEDALEDALLVPRGWLRNPQMPPIVGVTGQLSSTAIDISICECKTVAAEIRCIGAWLSRNGLRRRTCRIEDLSEEETRRARIFAERYGVGGEATLQSVGNQHGLTRERIRQVVEKMTGRLQGVTFTTPNFFKLKQLVQDSLPIALTAFDEKYREFLGEALSLEDADRFSREVLGIGIATISDRSMWQAGNAIKRMVLSIQDEEDGLVVAVRDASRRMIRSCGAAQIMYITGMVSETLNKPIFVTDVRQSIQSIEGMEWIAEDDGWFWFGLDTVNNRAIEIARKVLAIANNRVDVEEIQQAICRSRHRRASYDKDHFNRPPMVELPRHVLCEILSRVPYMTTVQYDDFAVKEKIQPEEALSEAELTLYNFLKQNSGIASRNALYKDVIGKNLMSVVNFQLLLATSPIIRPFGGSLFILRGWNSPVEAIQRAFESRPIRPEVLPLLHEQDGWLKFELRMTAYRFRSGLVDLPASAIRSIAPGDYEFEGVVRGKFSIGVFSKSNRITGRFASRLRAAGIRDGATLQLRVHQESRRVIVSNHQP